MDAWNVYLRGDPLVVSPGIRVTTQVEMAGSLVAADGTVSRDPGDDVAFDMVADYDSAAGRYRLTSLRLRSDTVEITGVLIRSFPVQAMLSQLLRFPSVLWVLDRDLAPSSAIDANGEFSELPRSRDLRSVALVYRLAQIRSESPAKAVEHAFGISQRTATNWIRRAREAGEMDG